MGGLQYCFEKEKDDKKNNKMTRLVRDNNRLKNNLFGEKGKIISAKDEEKKNNSFLEIIKRNKSSEKKEINIIKTKRRKNNNLSVENKHSERKVNYDSNSEKKSFFRKKKFLKYDKIGEGTYGKIYSCVKISGVDRYAVKIYDKINERQKKRIIKKFDILYSLNHQNILKAVSFNEDELIEEFGDFCILYESVNCRNVDDLMKEYRIFDEKLLKIYIKQILEGLKYLHDKKIYHKNLKPSNILVDEGTIKISDCLVDGLILGNSKTIYKNLLKSEKINYYIPPFFIKEMNDYNDKLTENSNLSKNEKSFTNWKSYDLWCLGCSIIEVATKKKPWSYYIFENNLKFIEFLGSTNLTPTKTQKLSADCQELIRVLFNYSLTKENDIYEKIFNLDFFKEKIQNANVINNNFAESTNGNHSDDSNSFSESEMQLGQYLSKNKVVNVLNPNENASFSVSYTMEENNSLSQSYKLNQSNSSVKRTNLNIKINNNKNNMMEKVDEALAQNEYSPDYVKLKKENNFELLK